MKIAIMTILSLNALYLIALGLIAHYEDMSLRPKPVVICGATIAVCVVWLALLP